MTKYGLPVIAALILTFSIFSIVRTQPAHATVAPPSQPPTPVRNRKSKIQNPK